MDLEALSIGVGVGKAGVNMEAVDTMNSPDEHGVTQERGPDLMKEMPKTHIANGNQDE